MELQDESEPLEALLFNNHFRKKRQWNGDKSEKISCSSIQKLLGLQITAKLSFDKHAKILAVRIPRN